MSPDRMAARLKVVDEHVRLENHHDLEGIMGTFGATAHYDDEDKQRYYKSKRIVPPRSAHAA